jgi:hypothetical protein
MSSISLAVAIERARESALTGDAATFEEHLRSVESLDRAGEAPTSELRMLAIVAAARRADLAEVDRLLAPIDPLPAHEWEQLHRWLLGAPEMKFEAYAAFVRSLDRRVRRTVSIPAARRWTPSIVLVLLGALLSLAILAWRTSAIDAAASNREAIEAVLEGDAATLLECVPSAWESRLLAAKDLMAQHASAEATAGVERALAELSDALRAAATSPAAARVAETLLGPRASPEQLQSLAASVAEWQHSPWLKLESWSKPEALAWKPSGDARLAWRTALRHMPLGLWLPGWFSTEWQRAPLQDEQAVVLRTSGDPSRITLQVLVGVREWRTTATRVQRYWLPEALQDRWRDLDPRLDASRCTAAQSRACQQALADSLRSIAAWITRLAKDPSAIAPPTDEIPWWVP